MERIAFCRECEQPFQVLHKRGRMPYHCPECKKLGEKLKEVIPKQPRTSTCRICQNIFSVARASGPLPKTCDDCKEKSKNIKKGSRTESVLERVESLTNRLEELRLRREENGKRSS